jgi:hypothetical protein
MKPRSSVVMLWLLLLFLAPMLFAQEGGLTEKVPRRILLVTGRQPDASFSSQETIMIGRSLLRRLSAASDEIVAVEAPPDDPAGTDAELEAAAGNAGADSWLSASLSGSWASMAVHLRTAGILPGDAAAVAWTVSREGRSSAQDLAQERWDDVTQPVVERFHMVEVPRSEPTSQRTARLTVRARAGTRVTGFGDGQLEIGEEGAATREVAVPREYILTAALDGSYPQETRIFVSADREVSFTQAPVSRWAIEAGLLDLGYPSVAVSLYVLPAQVFLKAGITTYALGLAFSDATAFTSVPLTNFEAMVGATLFPDAPFFHVTVGFGGLIRIVHAGGVFFGIDPLSPFALNLAFGAEVATSARGRLFIEWLPAVYLTAFPEAFRASLGSGTPEGWVFTAGSAQNLLSFKVGYRWTP